LYEVTRLCEAPERTAISGRTGDHLRFLAVTIATAAAIRLARVSGFFAPVIASTCSR